MTEHSYLTLDEARQLYHRGDSAHDFDHVLRVMALATRLATAEGADVTVVRLAALLHDVPVDDVPVDAQPDAFQHAAGAGDAGRHDHHLAAAAYAGELLAARGLGTNRIENVVHAIEAHRFRDQSIQPATLEAQCLYDADKLDSMGAIGVARCFAYAGGQGNRLWTTSVPGVPSDAAKPFGPDYTPVHEFVYKLQRLYATLHTATAQQIGRERHQFMVDFFQHFDREVLGEL